jgi:signal transduction histidine kinase
MKTSTVEELAYGRGQDFPIVIASMPASTRERRFAFRVIIFLLVAFLIIAPFASVPLARVDAFIPVLQTVLCVAELITAALLFAQYSIEPLRGVLALACGYMFSGLFAFMQTFAFPGAYAPAGLFGDLSTAAYLFCLWHIAFPLAVIVYALSRDTGKGANVSDSSTGVVIRIAITCVVALTAGLTWAVTAGARYLPSLFVNTTTQAPFTNYLLGSIWLLSAAALVSLFARKRTVLAVWLTVTVFATLPDLALSTVMTSVRFTLGWYVARSYALLASCTVLIALLTETTVLYGSLANAILLLRRERADRLMSLEAATAAMAHELKQPLSAMRSFGSAAQNWLKRTPPDVEKANRAVTSMIDTVDRADHVVSSTRDLFKKTSNLHTMVQLNDVVRQLLSLVQRDLQTNGISLITEYEPNLPQVQAEHTQLQQVILNLVRNAIDAMEAVPRGERRLRLVTGFDRKSVVSLYIQDSGPGITVENQDRIFDPFFTTKPTGMGLGLSICRNIIETHGGKLRLAKTNHRGSSFEITLAIAQQTGSRAEGGGSDSDSVIGG